MTRGVRADGKRRDKSLYRKWLVGMRAHLLTIVGDAEPRFIHNRQIRRILCRCDCGNFTEIDSVKLGSTKSCGCLSHAGLNRKNDLWYTEFLLFQRRNKRRNKDVPWFLTISEFKDLCLGSCFYCGAPPDILTKSGGAKRNSIDRLDNSGAYSTDNCVSCCVMCNFMKSSMHPETFVEHCRRVAAYK